MSKINKIKGRQVFDSRGNPTVEAEIFSDSGNSALAIVPSGASTGTHEAFELRDKDNKKYLGKSVIKAIENINGPIAKALKNFKVTEQRKIDQTLIDLDGSDQKKNLGANAILAVSIASCKLASLERKVSLFKNIGESKSFELPVPLLNIINGGVHAKNNLDIQEFMIRPENTDTFSEAIRRSFLVIQNLKTFLENTNVGDEGGFAPNVNSSDEIIEIIINSVEKAGFKINDDILLSLDVASTEFYKNNKYDLRGERKTLSSSEMVNYIENLSNNFPIYSIEDGMSEDDWEGWIELTKRIGDKVQLVGDDLFVTNIKRLKTGIDKSAGNAILVKLNQIGTLSETIDAINLGKRNNFSSIISHRSGETEDTTIADLSVAVSAGQIKTGSLSRTDRTAKYNQLLRIEEMLGSSAKYAGKSILKY